MRLREKVALITTAIILLQVIFVNSSPASKMLKCDYSKENNKNELCSATLPMNMKTKYPLIQRLKTKSKQPLDKSEDAIRKEFNFPDAEYPFASTPRTPFYLQERNILQRNQIHHRPSDLSVSFNPPISSTNSSYKNVKFNSRKYNNLAKSKITKNPTKTNPEFGTTSKPYCYWQGIFPEVEYPLFNLGVQKNDINPNSNSQIDKKSSNSPSKKKSITTIGINKLPKKSNSNIAPATAHMDTTISAKPCETSDFGTTHSYRTEKNNNINSCPLNNIVNKTSLSSTEKDSPKDFDYVNSTRNSIISLQDEASHITNIHDNLFTVIPDKSLDIISLKNIDTYPTITNQVFSPTYVATTPSYVSDDPTSVSSLEIHNRDDKDASISDARNTAVYENIDNKDTCSQEHVINSNTSSSLDMDEEFTTDVFPDFDENMLSVSTSTVSPMNVMDVDKTWVNSAIIDYKPMVYPDELEQYYIAVP